MCASIAEGAGSGPSARRMVPYPMRRTSRSPPMVNVCMLSRGISLTGVTLEDDIDVSCKPCEEHHMKIGALSRETGVSPRLLRYYEEQGLLSSYRTGEGGHRLYGADAAVVVRRIRTLLAAGLPTRVIRDVLPCASGSGEVLDACTLEQLRGRLTGLDEQMAELRATREALAAILAATERAGDLAAIA